MRRVVTWLVALAISLGLSLWAFGANRQQHPGHADFRSPELQDFRREYALSLGRLPLALARIVLQHDPEVSAVLQGVRAVRVHVYDVTGHSADFHRRLESTLGRLVDQDWTRVVTVRDGGGLVSVLVRIDDNGAVRGLAVVSQTDAEAVLVNVIGDIRPRMLSAAMAKFDIDLGVPPARDGT